MSQKDLMACIKRIETKVTKLLISMGVDPFSGGSTRASTPECQVVVQEDSAMSIVVTTVDVTIGDVIQTAYNHDLKSGVPIYLGQQKIAILKP